ncbi:MAG: GNAT family N-acetyltransferase [Pyrinomonadaceae bacterium]
MAVLDETAFQRCCFLGEEHFTELYATFTEAFSDYVFPFALTESQFKNHLVLNGVDLRRTAGCFVDGRLVGFSLNGFGDWGGVSTVYDAGSGVIPSHRRRHICESMFEMMLAAFRQQGIGQCLLEVINSNTGAIRLYEKLGFTVKRELSLLQCDGELVVPVAVSRDVEVRAMERPDWATFATFWDGMPSWQNSSEAIERSHGNKSLKGAFIGDRCVGYIIFSSTYGRAAQMAVDKSFRNLGVGTALLQAMKAETAEGYSMQIINIDKGLPGAMQFFQDHGFYERISQYEMVLPLSKA